MTLMLLLLCIALAFCAGFIAGYRYSVHMCVLSIADGRMQKMIEFFQEQKKGRPNG